MGRTINPLTRLRRAFRKSRRPALERTFAHWREHMAPYHFQRAAFNRYPSEYGKSAKRDRAKWLAARKRQAARYMVDPQARPLVKSRRFRQAFLHGSVLFTGSSERLRVRWASLPRHATLRNQYSDFSVAEAVTTVSDTERKTLRNVYDGWLCRFMANDSDIPIRTHGMAVLNQ
jgi:hypothetical protein